MEKTQDRKEIKIDFSRDRKFFEQEGSSRVITSGSLYMFFALINAGCIWVFIILATGWEGLKYFGHERDKERTPRAGAEIHFHERNQYIADKFGCLGMITEDNFDVRAKEVRRSDVVGLQSYAVFEIISTYSGEDDSNPKPPVFNTIDDIIEEVKFKGREVQEIADEFFEMLNPKTRICTVVAA